MDGEQPVAERVGDLFDPAPLRGCGIAGQQFDAATAVEARTYLVVLHLTPLSGKIGSHPAAPVRRHHRSVLISRAATRHYRGRVGP